MAHRPVVMAIGSCVVALQLVRPCMAGGPASMDGMAMGGTSSGGVTSGAMPSANMASENMASAVAARAALAEGRADARRGQFVAAIEAWSHATGDGSEPTTRIDALLGTASAWQMMGRPGDAATTLDRAITLARAAGDRRRLAKGLDALGSACTADPDLTLADGGMPGMPGMAAMGSERRDAGRYFEEAAQLATALGDHRLAGAVAGDRGNWAARGGRYAEATSCFAKARAEATAAGDSALAARSAANAAVSDLAAADDAAGERDRLSRNNFRKKANAAAAERARWLSLAAADNSAAYAAAKGLPSGNNQAFLLTTIGYGGVRLAVDALAQGKTTVAARDVPDYVDPALRSAGAMADALGDLRSASYAWGELGHLAEVTGRDAEAAQLTRRALLAAEQARAPESLYQWQWQAGRLQRTAGDLPGAIASYRHAVATLQAIRSDLALNHTNRLGHQSFRDDVGQVYFDLADALFREADQVGAHDEASPAVLDLLVEARGTVETLKSAELEDYFQDRCVQQLKAQSRSVDEIMHDKPHAAVVYVIPLVDRIELLVSTNQGLHRRTVPHGSAELDAVVAQFRYGVTYVADDEYIGPATTLYDWLIRPIEGAKLLSPNDTIVFVPDGLLRSVPMAALYDDRQHVHLIEKYAVAVSPGLTLMEPRPFMAGTATVLLNGLSDPVNVRVGGAGTAAVAYAALPNVPVELADVSAVFDGADAAAGAAGTTPSRLRTLINGEFIQPNVESSLAGADYAVVHIASHGYFGRDARSTYLVTHDGDRPLYLDDVEKLIRPKQFRGRPVELLTLSACETAVGDDRAALGLAGVAIKAGARSAMATLWPVNDATTAGLVKEFYYQLYVKHVSKAEAMRRAQVTLIHNHSVTLRVPYLWAPYLIIGNWM